MLIVQKITCVIKYIVYVKDPLTSKNYAFESRFKLSTIANITSVKLNSTDACLQCVQSSSFYSNRITL